MRMDADGGINKRVCFRQGQLAVKFVDIVSGIEHGGNAGLAGSRHNFIKVFVKVIKIKVTVAVD